MGVLTAVELSDMLLSSARILIIEDDPGMMEALRLVLESEGYNVTLAPTGLEGLQKILEGSQYDLLLLDVMLPDIDGWSILSRVRATPASMTLPIIMMTALSEEVSEVELLTAGADDYIRKPFSFDNLMAHIKALLRRSVIQSTNPLTGLPGNRQVERFLQQCASERFSFWAAAYVDIDHFKPYNDCYGFLRGDEVLRSTGSMLSGVGKYTSMSVFVGNIGGDDFFIGFSKDCERTEESALAEVHFALERVLKEFEEESKSFYTEEDRARGYVEAISRKGEFELHPLISLSIAVVTNAKRVFRHSLEIGNSLASVKHRAKMTAGNSIFYEQRKR